MIALASQDVPTDPLELEYHARMADRCAAWKLKHEAGWAVLSRLVMVELGISTMKPMGRLASTAHALRLHEVIAAINSWPSLAEYGRGRTTTPEG